VEKFEITLYLHANRESNREELNEALLDPAMNVKMDKQSRDDFVRNALYEVGFDLAVDPSTGESEILYVLYQGKRYRLEQV
jgi:hypothetical protein